MVLKRKRKSFRNKVPGRVWKRKKLTTTLLKRADLIEKVSLSRMHEKHETH